MDKTWTSYVILAIGIMMFITSNKYTNADDNQKTHTIAVDTESNIEGFVSKNGDKETEVNLVIDGEKHQFSIPEISDGESKTITTSDGKTVIVKSFSGDRKIVIDGKEVHIPGLGKHGLYKEGLSAMIGKTHQMIVSDDVRISASGLSDDVKSAIVAAVEGVLTSYDVKKQVSFSSNNFNFYMFNDHEMKGGMKIIKKEDLMHDGKKIQLKIIGDGDNTVEHEEITIIHEQKD